MMLCSEIRRKSKDDMGAVFDKMHKMEETMSQMKTAVDQVLQKLARLEPSLT